VARLDLANARVAAWRTRLAGNATVRELLSRPTLEARLELLRAEPSGGPPVVAPPPPGPGASAADPIAAAEAELRAAVRRTAERILRDVEGRRARLLLSAFLALDEAEAVKAVVRGVAAGAPLDRILAAAPPTPALPEPVLREAGAAAEAVAALGVLAAAGSAVAAAVLDAVPLDVSGGLVPLEIAADRAALGRARSACRRGGEDGAVLARHLEDRADLRNALTLLALGGAPPSADPFLAGGRRLPLALLRALAASRDVAAARAAVARAFHLDAAALSSPWAAERALEDAVARPLLREARRRPLSLAVPLSYLLARRTEARRLAVVLRGAALGLPADEILDLAEA
jgi:V/A-type H+-transporting ATPase subunit C